MNFKVGKITCTTPAAAQNVTCGFVPKFVLFWTIDNTAKAMGIWAEGMTAGYLYKDVAAANSVETSGGITQLETDDGVLGFTFGADGTLNEAGKYVGYIAIGD